MSTPKKEEVARRLTTGCAVCNTPDNLQRCARCRMVYYCGAPHQTQDFPKHKKACIKVKKATDHFLAEEKKLLDHRAAPNDMFGMPDDPLHNPEAVGHFWRLHDTRDYMRARYGVVSALQKDAAGGIHTAQSVEAQLGHALDMLRLCRGDNMGVRSLVPGMMLRLGRDQECYDFVKWWATTGEESDYGWGDTSLPYLDTRGADAMEEPTAFLRRWPELSHTLAVLLLKVKMLLDYEALDSAVYAPRGGKGIGAAAAAAAKAGLPREIQDEISVQLLASPIVRANKASHVEPELGWAGQTMRNQIVQLIEHIDRSNRKLLDMLTLRAKEAMAARPAYHSPGSPEEAVLAVQNMYDAWVEVPGALHKIKELMGPGLANPPGMDFSIF